MNKTIIKVQFADRYHEGEFAKTEYTYYLDAGLTVEPGQIITVPTKFGHTKAKVSKTNLTDGAIDMRYANDMRTITAADLETAPRADQHDKAAKPHRALEPTTVYHQVGLQEYSMEGDLI